MKRKLYVLFSLIVSFNVLFLSCDPNGGDDEITDFGEYKVFNNLDTFDWTYFILNEHQNYSLINDENGEFVSLYGIFSNDTIYVSSDLEEGVLSVDCNNTNIIQFVFEGDSVTMYSNEDMVLYPLNNSKGAKNGISNGTVLDFLFGKLLNELPVPVVNAIETMKLIYGLEYTNNQLDFILDGGYKLIPPKLFDWADKKESEFKSNPIYVIGIKTGIAEVNGLSAKCYVDGYLRADGNGTTYNFDYGICYSSTSSVPTINDDIQYKREVPFSPGNPASITLKLPISFNCSNLESETKYYYRAFFKDNITGMVDYAEEIKSFETEQLICDPDGYIAGHGYVDLGLPSGVKWATCNVGASSPEDYGDYFAWGETNPKAKYDWDTYLHWNDIDGDGRFDNGEATINSDISGNAQYDAATANWGGSWRMPTKDEMQELLGHCELEWTQVNGVNGAKVIGPNGSCIFLPAAGYRFGSSLIYDVGYYCHYWSSTPNDYIGYGYGAWYLYFGRGGGYVDWYNGRFSGLPVRPITE